MAFVSPVGGPSVEASLQDLAAKLGIPSIPSPKSLEPEANRPNFSAPLPNYVPAPQLERPVEPLPPAAAFDLMRSSALAHSVKPEVHSSPTRPPVLSTPTAQPNLLPGSHSVLPQAQPAPSGLSQVTDAWLQVAYNMLKGKNTSAGQPSSATTGAQAGSVPPLPGALSLPMQASAYNANVSNLQNLHGLLPTQGTPLPQGSFNLDLSKFSMLNTVAPPSDSPAAKKQRLGEGSQSTSVADSDDVGEASIPKRIKRVRSQTLNAQQAKEIYKMRPSELAPGVASVGHTAELAAKYHVATNTIRDIWNRRSWAKSTLSLWTSKELQDYRDTYAHTGVSLLWLDAYKPESS